MAERASVFQGVQLGLESVYGTAVPANKRLTGLNIEPGARVELETFTALGMKFATVAALNKEWAEASITGPITYTELPYILSSVMRTTTPSGATLAKTWTFDMASSAADVVKTFTIEQGSAERAHRMVGGTFSGLTMTFSRDGCELTGTIIAKALEDGVTMTASPTVVDLVPVMATQVSVKVADTQGGLTAAPVLDKTLEASWALTDRFSPVWSLNGSSSFPAMVEVAPTLELKLKLEADAIGMGLLTTMRTGATKFMRIEAVGTIIETTTAFKLTIDTACKVTDVAPFEDADGVYAVEWTLTGMHDATWTRATQVTVITSLTAL